jgi:acetyl esterase
LVFFHAERVVESYEANVADLRRRLSGVGYEVLSTREPRTVKPTVEEWIDEMLTRYPEDRDQLEALRGHHSPLPAPKGASWRTDVVYGTVGPAARGLVLDLYAWAPGERRPGIVFIHGGGWSEGHPYMLVRLAGEMAAAGYVTATISYRLSGEAKWPAALEDAKCAVRWFRSNAVEIGLDPTRIAVAGESAGGQLAAMIGLTPGRFEGTGGWSQISSAVQAVVLYDPALDLQRLPREETRANLRKFLPDAAAGDAVIEASPITYSLAGCPPVLTRVGSDDDCTPASVCDEFHERLTGAGVPNRLSLASGLGHLLSAVDPVGCLEATAAFLSEHLAVEAA